MGRWRIHAAFILYKTLGYPELGYEIRKYGIDEGDWKKVFSVFSHFPHISKAILFGSRVKGIHKPFSDVDIALVGEALSPKERMMAKPLLYTPLSYNTPERRFSVSASFARACTRSYSSKRFCTSSARRVCTAK